MPNVPITNHPLVGSVHTFRPDMPPYDPDVKDYGNYQIVLGNGMQVTIKMVFVNWNGVPGLDMLYVYCHATSLHTHITPSDLGLDLGSPAINEPEPEVAEYVMLKVRYIPSLISPEFMAEQVHELEGVDFVSVEDAD